MKKYIKSLLVILLINSCYCNIGFGQSRVILNGAIINIKNNALLVINNPNTNALTRYNGHIITEGENNKIKWIVGNTAGTYTVPLGYATNDYIPLIFTKTAGNGSGYFNLSSYHTGWNNSDYLPTGVLNVSYNGIDNSPFTIDRFWQIDAAGYIDKPVLNDLTFTYLDDEWTATGNSIDETALGAQRWNPNINDWGDFIPGVSIDVINNKIVVASVSAANLYKWWTLPSLNGNHALPVELSYFKGDCENGNKLLTWSTASEFNNKFFIVERSADGMKWINIDTINGAGNSNFPNNYAFTDVDDINRAYYRLKQVDFNKAETYSNNIEVNCASVEKLNAMQVYPNPSTGLFTVQNIAGNFLQIINAEGRIVYSEKCVDNNVDINLQEVSNGMYTIVATDLIKTNTVKLIIKH